MGIDVKISMDQLKQHRLFLATPMYGGVCQGLYARSVADLSALCQHYGIQLQIYYLFNESLIPRARNYTCDEFIRSGAEHMMFIDADIGFSAQDVIALMAMQIMEPDKYHIIGGPYAKKSLPGLAQILTEAGYQKIKHLVDTQYTGKVLSLNEETGKFEWNNVISHSKSKLPGKRWVRVKTNSKLKDLTCTVDHEVSYITDILNPNISFVNAETLASGWIAVAPSKNINVLYSKEQIQVLLGTVIGNSSVKNGHVRFGHSFVHKEYLEFKSKLLGISRNAQTVTISNLVRPNGEPKTIKNVIHLLDELSLAVWYMDNGNLHDTSVQLCTEEFSYEDHDLIVAMFRDKFDISVEIQNHDAKNRIHIPQTEATKFFNLIAPYVVPCMENKLPPEFRGIDKFDYETIKNLDYAAAAVNSVDVLDEKRVRYQYDLGVENNHNFVADGYVVHNCIAWEKIKRAVDKGLADENPNDLEKYVGDYVFNPKSGQGSIRIDEPAEVLEIGTGFMMITRDTLLKFQEAYPQYMYKPDHVRTQHFDGSRKIMQFFQAEIDPKSERYLSEDYWFTQKAQEIGLKTWLCPWMKLQHVGTHIYGGSLADLAALGVSATADAGELDKYKNRKK